MFKNWIKTLQLYILCYVIHEDICDYKIFFAMFVWCVLFSTEYLHDFQVKACFLNQQKLIWVTNRAPSNSAVLAHVLADLIDVNVVVSGTKRQIPRVRRELHHLMKTSTLSQEIPRSLNSHSFHKQIKSIFCQLYSKTRIERLLTLFYCKRLQHKICKL